MSNPSAHDGSDHSYRMIVEERYKHLSFLRPLVAIGAKAQFAFVLLRSLWKFSPSFLLGWPLSAIDQGILAAGVLLFLFYGYAFGYGRRQQEKVWAIMVYTMGSMVLLAECFLMFWVYHVLEGENASDPLIAAAYPPIPRAIAAALGWTGMTYRALDWFEKGLEGIGLFASAAGVWFARDFAITLREERRAVKEKRQLNVKED